MLKPFLKYVILDPNQSTHYSSFKSALCNALAQEAKLRKQNENDSLAADLERFLLDCFLDMQVI